MVIWTEIFNCGKIGNQAVRSYLKFHTLPVCVFGYRKDLNEIDDHPLIVKCAFKRFSLIGWLKYFFPRTFFDISESELYKAFKEGHKGTALLWTHLIKRYKGCKLIHFDSDVIFLKESISTITNALEVADLVGPVRLYERNMNDRKDVSGLRNVVQTVFFGFNSKYISKFKFVDLWKMVMGVWNPLGHSIIDFFDPVSFDMLKNGAKIFFLNADDFGGTLFDGTRKNKYSEINDFPTKYKIDFGDHLIHFSAVGSGMNFFQNSKLVKVPESYKKYAIDRYALYCRVVLNEDIGIDLSEYDFLVRELRRHVAEKVSS